MFWWQRSFSIYFRAEQHFFEGSFLQCMHFFERVKSTSFGSLWIFLYGHSWLPHTNEPRQIWRVFLPPLHKPFLLQGCERSQFQRSQTLSRGSFSLYVTWYFTLPLGLGGTLSTCTGSSLSILSWLMYFRRPTWTKMSSLLNNKSNNDHLRVHKTKMDFLLMLAIGMLVLNF